MAIVTVIIPVRDKLEMTSACLRALAAYSPAETLRVIVVDNGSTDDTAAECPALGRTLFGDAFFFLHFSENRHFGPACNAAAQIAVTDRLFFLNNDTLPTPGWLPPLLAALEEKPAPAGVGSLLLYPDHTVQHLGIAVEPGGGHLVHLYARLWADHCLVRKRRRFSAITAAALLLPASCFLAAGGFCEEYVNGLEDVDMGLQLTAGGGFMTVIPESVIIHKESQSAGRNDCETHNAALLRRRWNLAARADLAALVGADGYVLGVDPVLNITFRTGPEKSRAMLARFPLRSVKFSGYAAQEQNFAQAQALLREEPFWEDGYDLLANALRRAGRMDAAWRVMVQWLDFFPHLRAWRAALDMSGAKTGPHPDLRDIRSAYETAQRLIQDEKNCHAHRVRYAALCRQHGDHEFAQACERAGDQES